MRQSIVIHFLDTDVSSLNFNLLNPELIEAPLTHSNINISNI